MKARLALLLALVLGLSACAQPKPGGGTPAPQNSAPTVVSSSVVPASPVPSSAAPSSSAVPSSSVPTSVVSSSSAPQSEQEKEEDGSDIDKKSLPPLFHAFMALEQSQRPTDESTFKAIPSLNELVAELDRGRLPTGEYFLPERPGSIRVLPQILFEGDTFAGELAWWVLIFSPYTLKKGVDFTDAAKFDSREILETALRYVPMLDFSANFYADKTDYVRVDGRVIHYFVEYPDHILNYTMLLDGIQGKFIQGVGYMDDLWPVLEKMFGRDIYLSFVQQDSAWGDLNARARLLASAAEGMERFHCHLEEGLVCSDEVRRTGDFFMITPQIVNYTRVDDYVTFEVALLRDDAGVTPENFATQTADAPRYRYTLQMVAGSNPILVKMEIINYIKLA